MSMEMAGWWNRVTSPFWSLTSGFALLRAAAEHGARLLTGVAVDSLLLESGDVTGVITSHGVLRADVVVLAAGIATAALAAPLITLPMLASPAVLVRLAAAPGLVRSLVATPTIEIHEDLSGHDGDLVATVGVEIDTTLEKLLELGQRIVQQVEEMFAAAAGVRLRGVELGLRPIPSDGAPVVGRLPNAPQVYVAVMHSGVTLAPVIARLVTEEICAGVDRDELAGCRPKRFDHTTARQTS